MLATLIIAVLVSAWPAASAPNATSCQRRCSDLDIPFPFGIGRGCYHYTGEGDITFGLTCHRTPTGGHRTINGESVEVTGISLRTVQARVLSKIMPWCYNRRTRSMDEAALWWTDLSDEANRFTVIGCNSLAYVQSVNTGMEYMTACMATCPGAGRLDNGSCFGMGCCQAAIPRGINTYGMQFDDRFNTSGITGFSRCSYAEILDEQIKEEQSVELIERVAELARWPARRGPRCGRSRKSSTE